MSSTLGPGNFCQLTDYQPCPPRWGQATSANLLIINHVMHLQLWLDEYLDADCTNEVFEVWCAPHSLQSNHE